MVFVGLLLGMIAGGAIDGFRGAALGALLGLVIGLGLRQAMRRHDESVKEDGLALRLDHLESELRSLKQRLSAIESGAIETPTQPRNETPEAASPPATGRVTPAEAALFEPPHPALAEFPTVTIALPAAQTLDTDLIAAADTSAAELPSPASPQTATLRPRDATPAQPSFVWRWLTGGNTVVRVGMIILFFGVAFLLKYAYQHTHVPPALRMTGIALGAVALLFIGWRLREKRAGYAFALQGGGIGILYLTVFGSLRLYQLLPPEAAFGLLILIAVLSAVLAVLQNAQALAALGVCGGFLAPILASTGGGSHVMLFSYYAVLDLGILGIAWYKAWRPLNVLGFVFTFGIGTLWGARSYRPELFASTEPFLISFFTIYLAIPILFARRRAPELKSYVDGTLVFGTPLVAFGLQTQLVAGIAYGAAYSALTLSFVYLLVARTLFSRTQDKLRLLVEAFLALGVVFGTLAIPLALDGRWTSAAWALEGAAIVWIGVRQDRRLARAFGLFLQFAGGIAFLADVDRSHGGVPVLNSFYLGCLFISVAGLFCNWYLERHRERIHRVELPIATVVFFWGLTWWIGGGIHEIDTYSHEPMCFAIALLFAIGSCAAFSILWQRLHWRLAQYPALALLPAMALLIAATAAYPTAHPLAGLGALAWPLAFVAHLWLLRRHDERRGSYVEFMHAAQVWLLATIGAWEAGWAIDHAVAAAPVWRLIAWALIPGILLGVLAARGERIAWPVRERLDVYLQLGCAPLAVFLWLWIFYVNGATDGDPRPLPYVPILNPLDLAQLAALLAIVIWLRALKRNQLADYATNKPLLLFGALGAAAFVMLNASLLRTLHFWAGVPLPLDAMLQSMLVQAALSIFWTVLALAAMATATRLRIRALWITGASLMAVVVVKLLVVDLSNIGGIERIVSFIGVGLLMLLIGYFSPVPPRKEANA